MGSRVSFVLAFALLFSIFHSASNTLAAEDTSRPRLRTFALLSRSNSSNHLAECSADAQGWWSAGRDFLAHGKWKDGLRCLRTALRLGCASHSIHQDAGVACAHLQDYEGAIRHGQLALQFQGVPPETLLNVASALDEAAPTHESNQQIRLLLRQYIALTCTRDPFEALACSGRSTSSAIVELWRIGQQSCSNWDEWDEELRLLLAATDADLARARASNGSRYSIIQPWEASTFPLPAPWVVEIASLRSANLLRSLPPPLPFRFDLHGRFSVCILAHRASGLLQGLLRNLLVRHPAAAPHAPADARSARLCLAIWDQGEDVAGLQEEARAMEEVLLLPAAPESAARLLNARGLHVILDVMAWIPAARQFPSLELLALRPAPLQMAKEVHSSAGASFIDYILADHVALPPELASSYVESLASIPPSMLPNTHSVLYPSPDSTALPCEWAPSLKAFLAPYEYYKLDPHLFGLWLSLLAAHPSAVLVLQAGPFATLAKPALLAAAARKGIAARRVLFPPWTETKAAYMRRFRCGRMLLDTQHYSAHTVAVDALWAGTPLVTRPGSRLVSRIPASLLYAVGMEGLLIARDWREYQRVMSVAAASDRKWQELRNVLDRRRGQCEMYHETWFGKELMKVLAMAWDALLAGQARVEGRRPHIQRALGALRFGSEEAMEFNGQ